MVGLPLTSASGFHCIPPKILPTSSWALAEGAESGVALHFRRNRGVPVVAFRTRRGASRAAHPGLGSDHCGGTGFRAIRFPRRWKRRLRMWCEEGIPTVSSVFRRQQLPRNRPSLCASRQECRESIRSRSAPRPMLVASRTPCECVTPKSHFFFAPFLSRRPHHDKGRNSGYPIRFGTGCV